MISNSLRHERCKVVVGFVGVASLHDLSIADKSREATRVR